MKAVLILAAIMATSLGYNSDWQCLGVNKTTITFKNNVSKSVPDLWNVRIMQGGYASQWAVNYVAYTFMQQKLGINVSFYPTYDHDDIWNYFTWGANSTYPSNYWQWIKDDLMDVNFEFWPIQELNGGATGVDKCPQFSVFILCCV